MKDGGINKMKTIKNGLIIASCLVLTNCKKEHKVEFLERLIYIESEEINCTTAKVTLERDNYSISDGEHHFDYGRYRHSLLWDDLRYCDEDDRGRKFPHTEIDGKIDYLIKITPTKSGSFQFKYIYRDDMIDFGFIPEEIDQEYDFRLYLLNNDYVERMWTNFRMDLENSGLVPEDSQTLEQWEERWR